MSTNENSLFTSLVEAFPHPPNMDQEEALRGLSIFLMSKSSKPTFVLDGYAGTGKTTLLSTLTSVLPKLKLRFVLLAPTGRAAKVMSLYSGEKASTIHKKIYKQENDISSGVLSFVRQPNFHKRTVFIVDEASMISNGEGYNQKSLLNDLLEYVFEKGENRLMIIGDQAQLPPVHEQESPALNKLLLRDKFSLDVSGYSLTTVVRQKKESGILHNATILRNTIGKDVMPKFTTAKFSDIFRMTHERFEEGLQYAYSKYGEEGSIVICRSNKNANMYNQFIRRTLLFRDHEIEVGDKVMAVKNNYFWVEPDSEMGFIANGEFAEVRRAGGIEEMYGFKFCDLEMKFTDFPQQPAVQVKVILDTLYTNGPSLGVDEFRNLYHQVSEDYAHITKKQERLRAIHNDKYLNALQIKFAYAITGHKSQGGQWNAVFLDHGYQNPDIDHDDQVRWLYTAVTRAMDELFLVNFVNSYF